jgi:hypothetical protein
MQLPSYPVSSLCQARDVNLEVKSIFKDFISGGGLLKTGMLALPVQLSHSHVSEKSSQV